MASLIMRRNRLNLLMNGECEKTSLMSISSGLIAHVSTLVIGLQYERDWSAIGFQETKNGSKV